jgi:nucleoporin GLE1
MFFSPHRDSTRAAQRIQTRASHSFSNDFKHNKYDSDEDSLWSDSEEEEFPVNPSDSDEDEASTPEVESDFEQDHDDGFASTQLTKSIKAREDLLSSISDRLALINVAPTSSQSTPSNDQSNLSLHDTLQKWNAIGDSSKYQTTHQNEIRQYREDLKSKYLAQQEHIASTLQDLSSQREQRLAKHLQVIQEREEAERRRIEEERRKEEERLRKIEEEQQRKIKLEQQRREEEAKRKAEAEAAAKRKAEAEAKAKAEREAAAAAAAAKKKAEEEAAAKARKEAEVKAKADAKAKSRAASTALIDRLQIEADFLKYKQKIADIKTQILKPVTENKQMKSFCFQAKRKVRPKLGQLTDSQRQLQGIYNSLIEAVDECRNANEIVYHWVLNFFAKAVVAQAEVETIVSIQTATPLGKLAAMMMLRYEPLKELLLARFVKKCPLVIGYTCAIDTEEGRIRMGWKRKGEKWEEPNLYSERLSGICAVWTAITISQVQTGGQPHPYPVANSWRFAARMVNTPVELLTDTHFSVMGVWWDVASEIFLSEYGRQGQKLLELIHTKWIAQVTDRKYPSALRLLLLGEDWKKEGKLGKLLPLEP